MNGPIPSKKIVRARASRLAGATFGFTYWALLAGLLTLASRTLPGLHGAEQPAQALSLKPKAVRVLIHMNWYTLSDELMENGNAVRIASNKGGFPASRSPAILEGGRPGVGDDLPLEPGTADRQALPGAAAGVPAWDQALANLGHFVGRYGKWLDYLLLDNEPQGDYSDADWEPGVDGKPHVMAFLEALAARAQVAKKADPALSRLVITAPGVFNLGWFEGGRTDLKPDRVAELEDRVKPMLAWAAQSADIEALDAHAHAESVDDVAKILDYLGKNWKKPVVIAEWDQALCATAWLNAPLDERYRAKYREFPNRISKRKYMERCYSNRIPSAQWNDFMETAPFDPEFHEGELRVGQPPR